MSRVLTTSAGVLTTARTVSGAAARVGKQGPHVNVNGRCVAGFQQPRVQGWRQDAQHAHAQHAPSQQTPSRTRRYEAAAGGRQCMRPHVVAAGDAAAQHLLLGGIVPAGLGELQ